MCVCVYVCARVCECVSGWVFVGVCVCEGELVCPQWVSSV